MATGQQGAPIADGHGTARGGAAAGARAGEGGAAVCAAPKQLSTFPTLLLLLAVVVFVALRVVFC